MTKTTVIFLSLFLFSVVSAAAEAKQNSEHLEDFLRNCVENSAFDADDPNMQSPLFYREFSGKYKVVYANNTFFSYYADELSYTGGANGNRTVKAGSLYRKSGKKISLKEIAPDRNSKKKLQNLVIAETAKYFKCEIKDLPGKLLNLPRLNENFYLNDKGITFVFNEYEIAAKAAGPIKIFVPYTKFGIPQK